MADLYISYRNATYVSLDAESWLYKELDDVFTFMVPGYKFMPKYKAGIWDGKIRLIDYRTQTTYVGLVPDLIRFCKERGYSIELDDNVKRCFKSGVTDEEITQFYKKSKLPFEPHDYQDDAVRMALKSMRKVILSSTGSGKSFIIYLIVKFLIENNLKGIIVVPTVSLVEQLFSDFEDYSKNNNFPVHKAFHKIYSGQDKDSKCPVYISTWQSIYKMPQKYFHKFDFVIGDEVHLFEASSCNKIMQSCVNAHYRIGLTGTIQDAKVSEMSLTALFGDVKRVSSTADLIARKVLSDLIIRPVILHHDRKHYLENRTDAKYQSEVDYVVRSIPRLDFTAKLQSKLKGNTLVLFQFVDKHGKPLYEKIKEVQKDKKVFMVYGGTNADDREKIRKLCETMTDAVIVASYGVFSTGVNIVNIDNVIFTSPTKSKIRVLQSIGRGLRRGKRKTMCTLYDLVDDLSGSTNQESYSMTHFKQRLELYQQEGFEIAINSVVLKY